MRARRRTTISAIASGRGSTGWSAPVVALVFLAACAEVPEGPSTGPGPVATHPPDADPEPDPIEPVADDQETFSVQIDRDADDLKFEIHVEVKRADTNTLEPLAVLPSWRPSEDPGPETVSGVAAGDVISFTVANDDNNRIIHAFRVVRPGQLHVLSTEQMFQDSRLDKRRLPNYSASLSSYDIFLLDPLRIERSKDSGGGGMGAVFEGLRDEDTDWYEYRGREAIGVKDSFDVRFHNGGIGEDVQPMVYSHQEFAKSLGVNAGLSLGVAGKAGGKLGGSFKSMWGESSSRKQVFAYAKKQVSTYTVVLKPEDAKLDSRFMDAVRALPVPASAPASLGAAKADRAKFAAYRTFIDNWGTHYPTATEYGGYLFYYHQSTLEKAARNRGTQFDISAEVKGNVKGVDVGTDWGVSHSESSKVENEDSESKSGYMFVGGSGSPDSWQVGDNLMPIKVELERLDGLLTASFFKLDPDDAEEPKLAIRRKMLAYALQSYIGSVSDDGTPLKPRVFEMKLTDWTLKKNPWGISNEENIYGKVIGVSQHGSKQQTTVVWSRSEQPGSRVIAKQGDRERFPSRTLRIVLEPRNGRPPNPNDGSFAIGAELLQWHATGAHTCLGQGTLEIPLRDVSKLPTNFRKTLTLGGTKCDKKNYGNAPDGREIAVNANVKEIGMQELGFHF
ncbi:MAG: MAC/perforin domain-containing protein [Myxococcota bacterium]